jgi:hypothetical protein
MKAACSAKKAGTYQQNYMAFVCVCWELHTKRMAQSIMKPLTHLELLTLHGLLPCIMSDCSVCFALVRIFWEVPKVIMCINSNMKLYSFWGYLNLGTGLRQVTLIIYWMYIWFFHVVVPVT